MAQDIESVMTRSVQSVDEDAALIDAAKLMHEHDIGDVIVTDDGHVTGIVTDRDITIRGTARGAHPTETPVREVMSRDLVAVGVDQTVEEAIDLMRENALRRLPVIENGEVAGLVALGDVAVQRDEDSVLGEVSAADPNR